MLYSKLYMPYLPYMPDMPYRSYWSYRSYLSYWSYWPYWSYRSYRPYSSYRSYLAYRSYRSSRWLRRGCGLCLATVEAQFVCDHMIRSLRKVLTKFFLTGTNLIKLINLIKQYDRIYDRSGLQRLIVRNQQSHNNLNI